MNNPQRRVECGGKKISEFAEDRTLSVQTISSSSVVSMVLNLMVTICTIPFKIE
jgi:hypothetical protein